MAAGLTDSAARNDDADWMQRALTLARRGIGYVEPNPAVGAVVLGSDGRLAGEGWHARFGGPHAETAALQQAGDRARGGTLYVTLEPCAHHGQTPPCVEAILAAGLSRVVVAAADPAPHTAGRGLQRLREAGLAVDVGVAADEALSLIAPFERLMTSGRPWTIAKWAMTLDGKIASRAGHSQWITGAPARERAHELRGRMDGILVGIGTALADDPLLTARPAGPRTACRIILDSRARLPLNSQLVKTAASAPLLVVIGNQCDHRHRQRLIDAGVETLHCPSAGENSEVCLDSLLQQLGARRMTNLLVEGGARVLAAFFERELIDEVQCFLAPKLVGGAAAPGPIAGSGRLRIPHDPDLEFAVVERLGSDLLVSGRLRRTQNSLPGQRIAAGPVDVGVPPEKTAATAPSNRATSG